MPKRISKAKRPKRPRDISQWGHQIVNESTEEKSETPSPGVSKSEISRVMAEMGRRGGKIGGKKRLETMTPEQRSEVAHKAAQTRWAKRKNQKI